MNIGYFHDDVWPALNGNSIYSWEIVSRLEKKHKIYSDFANPLPGIKKIYHNWLDSIKLVNKVDVLLINTVGHFNWHAEKFSLFSLIKPDLKIIWITQSPIDETLLFSRKKITYTIQKLLRKFLARFVDANICVSEAMKKYSQTELKIKNSFVVPNGANIDIYKPTKEKATPLSNLDKFYKVFWAGQADLPWQGTDIIIKVANRIWGHDKNILFVIMTPGRRVPSQTQENILWLHSVPDRVLPKYLNAADAFLCIYHKFTPGIGPLWGSSMKLFNYMAMGKPIIATDVGQISTVIKNNKNGILTTNDCDDIIRKILFLKKNKIFGIKMGQAARKATLNYYNWGRVAREIEDILINTLKK